MTAQAQPCPAPGMSARQLRQVLAALSNIHPFRADSACHLYSLWVELAPNCTAHPLEGYGKHVNPRDDSSAVFTILDEDGDAVDELCPGMDYIVEIKFPTFASLYLTTDDNNTFSTAYNPEKCPNQIAAVQRTDYSGLTYSTILTVDCGTTGNLTLEMTWARILTDFYHYTTLTIPVNEECMSEEICPDEGDEEEDGGEDGGGYSPPPCSVRHK
eukprot:gene29392-5747_t